jgi:hypothetical protein
MSKTIITLHFLNVLIGCLCIAVLGLTTHGIVLSDRIDPLISKNIKDTGVGMLMWAGCGGIVDMLLFLCIFRTKPFHLNTVRTSILCYCVPSSTNKQQTTKPNALWQILALFVSTFIFIRPLIILIYTYVEYSGSIKSFVSRNGSYMTYESWACYVGTSGDTRSLCYELRAARYLLIPILVLATGMPAIVLWFRIRISRTKNKQSTAQSMVHPRT